MTIFATMCADPGDGNEWPGIGLELIALPHAGDMIRSTHETGTSILFVDDVIFDAEEGRVEVWVSMDGYDFDEFERAFRCLDRTRYDGERLAPFDAPSRESASYEVTDETVRASQGLVEYMNRPREKVEIPDDVDPAKLFVWTCSCNARHEASAHSWIDCICGRRVWFVEPQPTASSEGGDDQ